MPFFPNLIIGSKIDQVNKIELSGKSDQLKVPESAKSQIAHTKIPVSSNAENMMEDMPRSDRNLFYTALSA